MSSVAEKLMVIRTRSFTGALPEDVLAQLRTERFTGSVRVDMSQGGVCTVQVEDRSALPHLTPGNNSG